MMENKLEKAAKDAGRAIADHNITNSPQKPGGQSWDVFYAGIILRALRTANELCEVCGQPDNCGDCDHTPLTDADRVTLGI